MLEWKTREDGPRDRRIGRRPPFDLRIVQNHKTNNKSECMIMTDFFKENFPLSMKNHKCIGHHGSKIGHICQTTES